MFILGQTKKVCPVFLDAFLIKLNKFMPGSDPPPIFFKKWDY